MQVRRYNAWSARSAYYLAHMLTEQLSRGEDYRQLKSAIGIHLLDFSLFEQPEHQNQAVWCFEMRDRVKPQVLLGQELQLNLIKLPKADRLGLAKDKLAAWVTFFEHWCEEVTMANIAYQPVQDALLKVKDLSADAEARRLAFVRERALHDEVTEINIATEKGILIGEAKALLRLLDRRFGPISPEVAERVRNASETELERWTDRVLDVEDLDDIFK